MAPKQKTDTESGEAKPKKQKAIKGQSRVKGRAAGKPMQALRRKRRLTRAHTQAIKKELKMLRQGRSVTGIRTHITQIEYALEHPHTITKDGTGGGKKAPLEEPTKFNPPGSREPFFWTRNQRVWGSLAKSMNLPNGQIVSNKDVDAYWARFNQAQTPAKTEEVAA